MLNLFRTVVVFVLGSAGLMMAEEKSKVVTNPAYDKIKSLVGIWEGATKDRGKEPQPHARFQIISNGSAVAGWLNEGTLEEMLTMFHMDGNDLMATHYCAANNQPRMVLAAGDDPNRLVFKFKDGTNIQSGAGHMQRVTFILEAPNHHIEEWTYVENGKEQTSRFDFYRIKQQTVIPTMPH